MIKMILAFFACAALLLLFLGPAHIILWFVLSVVLMVLIVNPVTRSYFDTNLRCCSKRMEFINSRGQWGYELDHYRCRNCLKEKVL